MFRIWGRFKVAMGITVRNTRLGILSLAFSTLSVYKLSPKGVLCSPLNTQLYPVVPKCSPDPSSKEELMAAVKKRLPLLYLNTPLKPKPESLNSSFYSLLSSIPATRALVYA